MRDITSGHIFQLSGAIYFFILLKQDLSQNENCGLLRRVAGYLERWLLFRSETGRLFIHFLEEP